MPKAHIVPGSVRVAQPADAAAFAALCARTFVSAYPDLAGAALHAYVSLTFGLEQQRAELTDAGTAVFVVDIGAALAGYVLVRDEKPPVDTGGSSPLAIARLYLEPAARGQGRGSDLFRHVIAHAETNGHDQLWLTVWDRNTHAIQVYESWGFEDVGSIGFDFFGTRQTDRVLTRPLQVG